MSPILSIAISFTDEGIILIWPSVSENRSPPVRLKWVPAPALGWIWSKRGFLNFARLHSSSHCSSSFSAPTSPQVSHFSPPVCVTSRFPPLRRYPFAFLRRADLRCLWWVFLCGRLSLSCLFLWCFFVEFWSNLALEAMRLELSALWSVC